MVAAQVGVAEGTAGVALMWGEEVAEAEVAVIAPPCRLCPLLPVQVQQVHPKELMRLHRMSPQQMHLGLLQLRRTVSPQLLITLLQLGVATVVAAGAGEDAVGTAAGMPRSRTSSATPVILPTRAVAGGTDEGALAVEEADFTNKVVRAVLLLRQVQLQVTRHGCVLLI